MSSAISLFPIKFLSLARNLILVGHTACDVKRQLLAVFCLLRRAALFDERGEQVKPVSHKPLLKERLSNGKTAVKHLQDLGVSLE